MNTTFISDAEIGENWATNLLTVGEHKQLVRFMRRPSYRLYEARLSSDEILGLLHFILPVRVLALLSHLSVENENGIEYYEMEQVRDALNGAVEV